MLFYQWVTTNFFNNNSAEKSAISFYLKNEQPFQWTIKILLPIVAWDAVIVLLDVAIDQY